MGYLHPDQGEAWNWNAGEIDGLHLVQLSLAGNNIFCTRYKIPRDPVGNFRLGDITGGIACLVVAVKRENNH